MKKPVRIRLLTLIGLCALALTIMGGGTECPKKCVVEDAGCETTCNGGLDGICKRTGSTLHCVASEPNGDSKGKKQKKPNGCSVR